MKRIVWITVGRRRYMELQYRFLVRQLDAADKFVFCLQRLGAPERQFVNDACAKYPDKFSQIEIGRPNAGSASVVNLLKHPTMHDENTLYIKMDDDIIFLEDGTLDYLFRLKESRQDMPLIFPNIINNAITNYLHQKRFVYDAKAGVATWSAFCDVGLYSAKYCQHVHDTFLRHAAADTLDAFRFPPFRVMDYQRISIGCIAYAGRDLKDHLSDMTEDCEKSMAMIFPRKMGCPPVIAGEKIVCHFSYHMQEEALLKTDVLGRYERLTNTYTKRPL